jgi:hypothetical protein
MIAVDVTRSIVMAPWQVTFQFSDVPSLSLNDGTFNAVIYPYGVLFAVILLDAIKLPMLFKLRIFAPP